MPKEKVIRRSAEKAAKKVLDQLELYRGVGGETADEARKYALNVVLPKGAQHSTEEPMGRYWAFDKNDVGVLIEGIDDESTQLKPYMQQNAWPQMKRRMVRDLGFEPKTPKRGPVLKLLKGELHPDTKVKLFSTRREWEEERRRIAKVYGTHVNDVNTRQLTDYFINSGYEAVAFPDFKEMGGRMQLVQLQPGTVKAKLGKLSKWLAVTGVLGTGLDVVTPDEAEAFPRGIFKVPKKKLAKEIAEGVYSSAHKDLKGKELQGRIIESVRKTGRRERALTFTDGTVMTLDKDDINALARSLGTRKYVDAFKEKDKESQILQAMKSLKYHQKRAMPVNRNTHRLLHRDYLKRSAEMTGGEYPDTVFVLHGGTEFFQMPREYAEILEGMGKVKILKDPENVRATKPKGKK